ncbi:MAG TPA: TetR/AcrR family transcriptional regulator [Nannocystaceae bacterium]|nr:TetR/AcrR family transcriptional regulator [Nannocystaceae bacterium]
MRLPAKAGLHDAIVRSGIELGSELGEEGLTMRAIAGKLGISATALYQHFESKASILREIRLHAIRMLMDRLDTTHDLEDCATRLREISRLYLRFSRNNPWLYKLLFQSEDLDWAALPEEERRDAMQPYEHTRRTFADGVAAGVFRSDLDVDQAALLTWASLHGLASLVLQGRITEDHPAFPVPDLEAFAELFIDNMVRAYLAAP